MAQFLRGAGSGGAGVSKAPRPTGPSEQRLYDFQVEGVEWLKKLCAEGQGKAKAVNCRTTLELPPCPTSPAEPKCLQADRPPGGILGDEM